MEYLGLVAWIVAFALAVKWARSFRKRKYDIVGQRRYYYILSAIILSICIGSLLTRGVKQGLDFTGGSIVEAGVYELTTPAEIEEALNKFEPTDFKLGDIAIQTSTDMVPDEHPEEGKPAEFQRIILRLTNDTGTQLEPAQTREILDYLSSELGDLKELRTASIGPTISDELTYNAIKALLWSLVLQLLYIFFRFGNQLRYGIATDVALVHDVIIMIGLYSLAGREIDSPFVAAVLTVVGYSVMDSVVIFDRIRENSNNWWAEHGYDEQIPYADIVNQSVGETMTRSINTMLTTLITLLAIFYFGGSTLQNFAFSLLVGIVAGAYSSICIGAPLLVTINNRYPVNPLKTSSWGDLDDEVVPEDFMPDSEKATPAPPRPKKAKAPVPKLVDDNEPAGDGGRRRKRGKRS